MAGVKILPNAIDQLVLGALIDRFQVKKRYPYKLIRLFCVIFLNFAAIFRWRQAVAVVGMRLAVTDLSL